MESDVADRLWGFSEFLFNWLYRMTPSRVLRRLPAPFPDGSAPSGYYSDFDSPVLDSLWEVFGEDDVALDPALRRPQRQPACRFWDNDFQCVNRVGIFGRAWLKRYRLYDVVPGIDKRILGTMPVRSAVGASDQFPLLFDRLLKSELDKLRI